MTDATDGTGATGATDGTAAPGEIRVMLVDDEALMRSGLSLMLDGAAGLRVVEHE